MADIEYLEKKIDFTLECVYLILRDLKSETITLKQMEKAIEAEGCHTGRIDYSKY